MFSVDSRSTDPISGGTRAADGWIVAEVEPRPWCVVCRRRPRTLEELSRRVVLTAGEIERKGDER